MKKLIIFGMVCASVLLNASEEPAPVAPATPEQDMNQAPEPMPASTPVEAPAIHIAPPPVIVAPNFSSEQAPAATSEPAPAPPVVPVVPSAVVEPIDDAPLFAGQENPEAEKERKELYTTAMNDEKTAQGFIQKIDDSKSERLKAHLALDGELDAFFSECGMERGKALGVIENVQNEVEEEIAGGGDGDVSAQERLSVDERKKLLTNLESSVKMLQEKETSVVDALKVLSQSTNGLSDKMEAIISKRIEIRGVADNAIAKTLGGEVSAATKEIQAGYEQLTTAGGDAKKVDDAIADARAALALAKTAFTTVKAKITSLGDSIKKHGEGASSPEPEAKTSEPAPAPAAKKKKSTIASQLRELTQGTVFEKPVGMAIRAGYKVIDYAAPLSETVKDMAGSAVAWVREMAGDTPKAVSGDEHSAPVKAAEPKTPIDSVLEKIQEERVQSSQKMQELVDKKKEIDDKVKLLDRLEVERVMQLDKHEDVVAALHQAYERTDRELSWSEIATRIFWKAYATARRMLLWVYRFIGDKIGARETVAAPTPEVKTTQKPEAKPIISEVKPVAPVEMPKTVPAPIVPAKPEVSAVIPVPAAQPVMTVAVPAVPTAAPTLEAKPIISEVKPVAPVEMPKTVPAPIAPAKPEVSAVIPVPAAQPVMTVAVPAVPAAAPTPEAKPTSIVPAASADMPVPTLAGSLTK